VLWAASKNLGRAVIPSHSSQKTIFMKYIFIQNKTKSDKKGERAISK